VSTPRRAATVLILRDAPGASPAPPEVLLVQRSRAMAFMAGAYVFPGGRVDAADAEGEGGEALATRRCAAREAREEVGLDLPDPAAMPLFSRWITPSAESRRFDTDFFLAALPAGQEVRIDAAEITDALFLQPEEALARAAAGRLFLPPPTLSNLEDLLALWAGLSAPTLAGLLRRAAERAPSAALAAVMPKLVADPETGAPTVIMPWDPEFAAFPGEGTPLPEPPGPPRRTARVLFTPQGIQTR
jgi:8-oxo-dGTP pyrophosphatase MutT (NUDIX family)